jgi:hypothetical protein
VILARRSVILGQIDDFQRYYILDLHKLC